MDILLLWVYYFDK